jgi:2-polyprenyl-3-methyl-5-hydroxy-6-metoxy-1,4-benzoquinol methylase
MRHIAKCTKIQAGNLLDYGCGKANFVSCNSILFPQWSFYGYDFNKKIKTGKGLAKIYQAPNIKKTKLPKQSFDVVTLVETIEHFTKLTEEIKNIQAYLKKDGFLYIETGNQESIAAKLMGKRHRYYEIYHTVYFSIKTIKSFLEKNGFKIIKISDYPTNRDLKSMRQLGYAVFLRNLLMYSAGLVRLNNFSITGGMSILAQKQ